MATITTQFADFQKSQLNAAHALSHVALNATEKLVNLNLAAAKAVLDESAANSKAILGVKDAQEFLAVNGTLAQPALEKVIGYTRNVVGILSGAGAEVSKIVESQIADSNSKAAQFVDLAAKSAPAGSEPVVSLLKKAVAGSSTAYDSFAKAAKQAVDAAESNFTAATEATINAVSTANEVIKSKKVA